MTSLPEIRGGKGQFSSPECQAASLRYGFRRLAEINRLLSHLVDTDLINVIGLEVKKAHYNPEVLGPRVYLAPVPHQLPSVLNRPGGTRSYAPSPRGRGTMSFRKVTWLTHHPRSPQRS